MTIMELLTGGIPQRILQLRGSGLPHRPAAWKSGNRLNTTWYPGNGDEATQQNMGPIEMPSNWSGEWRYRMLSRTPAKYTNTGNMSELIDIIQPVTLVQLIEEMFRGGHRLRVIWFQGGDGPQSKALIMREGQAKEWEFPVERAEDIQWNIQWEWQSRGRGAYRPVEVKDESVETKLADMRAKAQAILDQDIVDRRTQNTAKLQPNNFTLGQLEALANYPNQLQKVGRTRILQFASTAQKIVDIANKVKGLPFAVSNSVLELTRTTVQQGTQFISQISRVPPELMNQKTMARDLLYATKNFGRSVENTRVLMRSVMEADLALRKVNTQVALAGIKNVRNSGKAKDIVKLHVVKSGDTPVSISIKYFGDPDHVADIMRANNLPFYQVRLKPGIALVIPNYSANQAVK